MRSFLICLLCLAALTTTACPDLQKFAEAVDQSNTTWLAAHEDLKVLANELKAAATNYEAVIKTGDKDEIEKAKYILEDLSRRYESKEKEVDAAAVAVQGTIQQYEDAKAQGNYLWSIPGMILGGVAGAFGLKLKLGPIVSALSKTLNSNRSALEPSELEKVKDVQAEVLTPAEKKVVARALGKG